MNQPVHPQPPCTTNTTFEKDIIARQQQAVDRVIDIQWESIEAEYKSILAITEGVGQNSSEVN